MSEVKLSKLEQIRLRAQERIKQPWVLGPEDGFDPPLVVAPLTARQRKVWAETEGEIERAKSFVGAEQWDRLWEAFADEDGEVLLAVFQDIYEHFHGRGAAEVPTKTS